MSGTAPEARLNMEAIAKKFPYGKLKEYRISNNLKLTAPVDNELFMQLFQNFKTAPRISINKGLTHEQIHKGEDYLLGNHGRMKNGHGDDSVDVITVLVSYKGKSEIYFLCYASADWEETEDEFHNSRKGEITRPYLGPSLAENYQTDSTLFESYSTFSDDNTYRKTSVYKRKDGTCLDSTIEIFGIHYFDMAVMEDNARYTNGKLQYDFTDPKNK
ncbi:MAG: hypothetical protein M3R17_14280 [Bacteroidota bacterium]|nr:hypothetical protein [Bacteroidota bacterium]